MNTEAMLRDLHEMSDHVQLRKFKWGYGIAVGDWYFQATTAATAISMAYSAMAF
jgi:hypothetical protein